MIESLTVVALYMTGCTVVGFIFQVIMWIRERND